MRFIPLVCLLSTLAVSFAQGRDPRIGDVDPVLPTEKVDRALNGTFDFPPPPVSPEWTPDARGFAPARLFHVPKPGVHPRILFAPEDLLHIRQTLAGNEEAKGIVATLRSQVSQGVDAAGTWEGQCFKALLTGDLDAFKAAYKENPLDNNPPGSGFKYNIPGRNPATKWVFHNPLLMGIEAKAFLAMIDDDAAAGRQVACAMAAYARYVSPRVDAVNAAPRHEFHWTATRDLVPGEVAYVYDWAWQWMTPEQRDALRSLIVRATAGKYTVGMDLPRHWRNWNHLGITESYAICALAIEGEPGDDPRCRERIREVYADYLTYGIDDLGFGAEGIGYQTAGFGHLSSPLLGFANRGKNLFLHPHWRAQIESWLVQAMQPFGGAWQSNCDLGNFPPALSYLQLAKYFFPASPGVDFVYRNHPLIEQRDWGAIARDACEAQWIAPALPGVADTREVAQHAAAALAGGGLTFYDKGRGSLYTRTGWGRDDLSLHVDCRVDTTFANHDHPDRGQFTLAALGRAWACDGYRDTESKYHNLVTIDGRGQGYFAAPGRWISEIDDAHCTEAVVDAKYCWDWLWAKSTFTESRASLVRRSQGVFAEAAERLQKRIPLDQWEPDPTVAWYYQGFADRAHGDPRMWDDEDGWVPRAPWYPVRKAFRTIRLVRGAHPFVLIADDIRKDDAEHLYEWRMNMPPDVAAVSLSGSDILLGDSTTHHGAIELRNAFQGNTGLVPAAGDRLLLVRILDIGVPELPTLQPSPIVGTVEYKKTDDVHQFAGRSMGLGTQVVIGSRSVEPRFLILLYPYRQGAEVPQTDWSADRSSLSVKWRDEEQTFAIRAGADGRRLISPAGQLSPAGQQ